MKAKELQTISSPDNKNIWTVGGKVAVSKRGYDTAIRTISRITDGRGGTIYIPCTNMLGNVTGEDAYDLYGRGRGGGDWDSITIRPIGEIEETEIKKKFLANKLRQGLQKKGWSGVPDDIIIGIYEYLKTQNVPLPL